ncbi:MAG: hypothetical protein ABIQ95_12920 [Bdellovibrionia bacterium]
MKKFLVIVFSILFFSQYSPNCFCEESVIVEPSTWARLNDIYFENIRLSKADTFVGYTQIRSGMSSLTNHIESYAVIRAAMDTRTLLGTMADVYNDNFLFVGAGFDYLGFLPGVRLTAQAGASMDLSSKIHQGGLDYRFGSQSYHEIRWNEGLKSEIYSEALYFRRYSNFLTALQFRTIYSLAHWKFGAHSMDLGPLATLVGSLDSEGLDYNRFAEVRLGARLTLQGPFTFALSPYYVIGGRWARPTDLANYADFRVLLSGSISL